MKGGLEICKRVLLAQWCILHLELDLSNGGDSMGSIACDQGQAEVSREPLALVPISEDLPQDVLESFGVQENQEGQVLRLIPVTCLHSVRPPIRVLLIPPPLRPSIAPAFTIERSTPFTINSLRVPYLDTVPYQSRLSDVILRSCSV